MFSDRVIGKEQRFGRTEKLISETSSVETIRRDDLHRPDDRPGDVGGKEPKHPEARQSEMPVSRSGMNQESRQHNNHNDPADGADTS